MRVKKLLSVLLTMAMLLTMFPTSVLADYKVTSIGEMTGLSPIMGPNVVMLSQEQFTLSTTVMVNNETLSEEDLADNFVFWEIDDTSIVDFKEGEEEHATWAAFEPKAAGTATVTASITLDEELYTETFKVRVQTYIITLDTSEVAMLRVTQDSADSGQIQVISVTPEADPELTGTWASSATDVATIEEDGTVTAVSPGRTTITYTLGDSFVTADIDILPGEGYAATTFHVLTQSETVITPVGEVPVCSLPYEGTVVGDMAYVFNHWEDDTAPGGFMQELPIATENMNRSYTAIFDEYELDGSLPSPVEYKLSAITAETFNIKVGDELQLTAPTVSPNIASTIGDVGVWGIEYGEGTLATITDSGKLTALAAGNVQVYYAIGGAMVTASVEISDVDGYTSDAFMIPGFGANMTPTTLYVVTQEGEMPDTTAIDAQAATIVASANTDEDHYTFTGWEPALHEAGAERSWYYATYSSVSVHDIEIPDLTVPAEPVVVENGGTEVQLTAPVVDFDYEAFGLTPTWSANPESVATITQDGLLTFHTGGDVNVMYTIGPASKGAVVHGVSADGYATITFSVPGVGEERQFVEIGTGEAMPEPTISTDREATIRETYEFTGWMPEFAPITADVTYVAQYNVTPITRLVTFQSDTGVPYSQTPVQIGDIPSPPETPADYGDSETWHTFQGWSPTITAVEPGTEDIVYTAVFDEVPTASIPIEITIHPLDAEDYPVSGGDPIQLEADVFPSLSVLDTDIIWMGDDDTIATVTPDGLLTPLAGGTVNITADVRGTQETVQLRVNNPEGYHTITYVLGQVENAEDMHYVRRVVQEGTMPPDEDEIDPTDFYNSDITTVYEFIGWSPDLAPVTGDTIYIAQYMQSVNRVNAVFMLDADTQITVVPVIAGQTPYYNESLNGTPTKPAEGDTAYVFRGWTPEITAIEETTYFFADFEAVDRSSINYNIEMPSSISMGLNETATLDIASNPEGLLHTESIHWTTTNPDVVTVDQDTGLITAVGEGSATVMVTDGVQSQSCFVTVSAVTYDITWVVDGQNIVETYPIGATPVFKSTPTKAGTMSTYWAFTGWTPSIRAVTANATYTAQFEQYPLAVIDLSTEYLKLVVGSNALLTAEITPEEGHQEEVWKSSDPTVVSVDEMGNLTAVGVGSATITCTVGPTVEQCLVDVVSSVTYEITWKIEEDTYKNTVNEGDIPVYDRSTPTKAATEQHTYRFTGWVPTPQAAYQDRTYTARFEEQVRTYTIRFNENFEGGNVHTYELQYGDTITPPADPHKPDDERYTYEFSGWTPFTELNTPVRGNVDFTANYNRREREHVIIRYNDADAPDTDSVMIGSSFLLTAEIVPAGAAYTWSSSNPSVATIDETGVVTALDKGQTTITLSSYDGTMTDTLVLTVTKKQYTITFDVDGDISEQLVDEGDTPVYLGTTDKEPDNSWVYTFEGWNPEIAPATGNVTYTAQYSKVPRLYTIKWVVQGNETVEQYTYGSTPEYPGTEDSLKMEGDETQSHLFTGWTPRIALVTEDTTYTATYQDVQNIYVIAWDVNGTVTREEYNYGQMPEFKGSTDKEPTNTATFTFKGWQKPLAVVTESTTYVAQYTESVRKYTIKWDVDGNFTTEQYEYNQSPTFKAGTPTKADNGSRSYTFTKWEPEITRVSADATYKAVFAEHIKTYKIVFRNWDNTILQQVEVEANTLPKYTGSTPTRASTTNAKGEKVTYKFEGWSPTIASATEDATYVAQFSASDGSLKKNFTVTFKDWDGTVLLTQQVQDGTTPTYSGKTPTRENTKTTTYKFAGWTPELGPVTKDTTYTAKYITNSPTEWSLEEDELEKLAKAGKTVSYEFTAGTLYINAEGLEDLAAYKDSITINVTEEKSSGKVSVTIKKDDKVLYDNIDGMLFYSSDMTYGNVVKVASGKGKYYDSEVFSSVSNKGTYTRLNGTSTLMVSTESATFSDVGSSNWANRDIAAVAARGIMVGTGDNTFSPQGGVTRAQAATILYRIAESPRFIGGTAYNDVPANAWYIREVFWSSAEDIIPGAANGIFGPDVDITREDLVTGFYNLTKYFGYTVTDGGRLGAFKDAGQIASSKIDAFKWAVSEGIINGTSATTLSPKAQTTRAEMAAIVNRYITYILQLEASGA